MPWGRICAAGQRRRCGRRLRERGERRCSRGGGVPCAVAFTRGPGRVWRLSQQVSTLLARRTASAAEEAREPKREMRGLSLIAYDGECL